MDYARLEHWPPTRPQVQGLFHWVALRVSVSVLLASIYVAIFYNVSSLCTRVILWPMVAIGLFFVVISALGCYLHVSVTHDGCLMLLYSIGLLITIFGLLALLIFGFIAVGGVDFSEVKIREYHLSEYSGWLRGRVDDPEYWSKISACLRDKDSCDGMTDLVPDPGTGIFVPEQSWWSWAWNYILSWVHLSTGDGPMPIEAGCCKPPSSCAFTYVNGTTWIPTPGARAVETNVDCSRWSNEQQTLCFQCDSCKAGFLDENKKSWSLAALAIIFAIMVSSRLYCLRKELVFA